MAKGFIRVLGLGLGWIGVLDGFLGDVGRRYCVIIGGGGKGGEGLADLDFVVGE